MARYYYYSVKRYGSSKMDEVVKGQSYKTVARRVWGDNLRFNVMHEGGGNVDVQVYKRYADGSYRLKGRITDYDPDFAMKIAADEVWMADLKRAYRKAGGRRNFMR